MSATHRQKKKYNQIKEHVFGGRAARWADSRKDGSIRYSWPIWYWEHKIEQRLLNEFGVQAVSYRHKSGTKYTVAISVTGELV